MSKTDSASKTKSKLLKTAQRMGLRGISTMNKTELADLIHQAQQRNRSAASKQPMGAAAVAKRVAEAVKRRAVRKRELAKQVAQPAVTTKRVAAKPSRRGPSPIAAQPVATQPAAAEEAVNAAAEELSAHKFDVTPAPPPPRQVFIEEHLGELPEAYGTGRLFLTPRDPHWLYAYWDLRWQQMADYRGQSADGRLLLRVYEKNHRDPIQSLTLGYDARNWYIPVNKAATTYSAELGFWRHDSSFHVISRSREATTPPDVVSADTSARFVTIPVEISFRELLNIIRGHMHGGEALADALHRLQRAGFKFPFKVGIDLGPWSAEQAAELERLLGGDILRRMQMGSFEISEWLRRRLQEEISSGTSSVFSPAGV